VARVSIVRRHAWEQARRSRSICRTGPRSRADTRPRRNCRRRRFPPTRPSFVRLAASAPNCLGRKKYDLSAPNLTIMGCVAATVSLLRAFAGTREMAIKSGVICGRRTMRHFLALATILAATLGVLFVAISYHEASAQTRVTCSQARSNCGTQRICQKRYEACMETGCWTVSLLKKCGYEKR
jgi:hypothetical protein